MRGPVQVVVPQNGVLSSAPHPNPLPRGEGTSVQKLSIRRYSAIRLSRSSRSICLRRSRLKSSNGETGGDDAVAHRLLERLRLEVSLLGEIAHHPAGKAVAGPGGIDDVRRGIGGEDVDFMFAEEHRPMLALLDDHQPRSQAADRMAGADEVFLSREQFRLAVVEHQAVDPPQEDEEAFPLVLNVIVHRVGDDQGGAGALVEHAHLQLRRGVGEEEKFAAAIRLRQCRIELRHHVQLQVERLAVVHVFQVSPPPTERLSAGDNLQSGGVDVPFAEQFAVFLRPILADGAGEPHGGEVTGGVGEEDGRAAQQVIALLRGGFHAVQRDRSNNDQGHDQGPLGTGDCPNFRPTKMGLSPSYKHAIYYGRFGAIGKGFPPQPISPSARSIRARLDAFPKIARQSNSPGPTALPVTATRRA